MNLKERAFHLKRDIPAVYLCLKSRETPLSAKIFAALAVAYALSPVDLIPDFIPVLGYLDDLLILPVLVALAVRFIPKETFHRCQAEAAQLWKDRGPKRWYYAVPIVLFWLLLFWLILRAIF